METQEIRYGGIGEHEVGDIWGTQRYGVFVVIAAESAKWRGEDRDVYAHVDTWYTIRPANDIEQALWNAAVEAAGARKALRKRLIGGNTSYQFDAAKRQLVSTMRRLDSYDDRWNPPKPVDLSDEDYAIEQGYVEAVERLHGHNGQEAK